MTDKKVLVKFSSSKPTEIGVEEKVFSPHTKASGSSPPEQSEERRYNLRSKKIGESSSKNYEESKIEQQSNIQSNTNPHTMANNTTILQASEAMRTPALPKFVSPMTFNPTNINAVAFMKNYERCSVMNAWNDALKINYLGSFLEAAGSSWFLKYTSNEANQGNTWTQLKEDFIKEFGGESEIRATKFKFNTRRQHDNEDIKSYYFDLTSLADELDPNMAFETFRDRFENGLHPIFYESYFLIAPDNMDMDALKKVIFKLSNVKERVLSKQMSNLSLLSQPAQETPNREHSTERRHYRSKSPGQNQRRSRDRRGRPYCTWCQTYGHYRSSCRNRNFQEATGSQIQRTNPRNFNRRRSNSPHPNSRNTTPSNSRNHPNAERRHH